MKHTEQNIDRTRRRRRPSPFTQNKRARLVGTIIGIIALLVIAAIPAFGYYQALVAPNHELVIQVNDIKFTMGDYVKLLRIYRTGTDATGQSLDLSQAPFQLLQVIEDNELISQAAPRYAIEITPDDLQKEIEKRVLPPPKEGEVLDLHTVQREYQERYRQRLNSLGLTDTEYRRTVRYDLARAKLRDILGVQVPKVAPQVHAYGMLLQDQATADQIKAKLNKDGDFKALAKENSKDDATARKGGDLGWLPRTVRPEFDDLLFGLAVNDVSLPIETQEGFYLIKLISKTADDAHIQAILIKDSKEAFEIRNRWSKGEDFQALAQEVNQDPTLKGKKGELGIIPRGYKGGGFDTAIFGSKPGTISGSIFTTDGVWLLKITETSSAQEISEDNREILKNRVLDNWLLGERKANKVLRYFNSDRYEWVIEQLRIERRPTPQAGSAGG